MRVRILLVIVALILGALGGSAWGANPFTDIGGTGVHMDNIDAIYNAGITTGCATPNAYCPADFVTRAQMASFLARGMGLSSGNTKNFPKANGRSDWQVYCKVALDHPLSFDTGGCAANSVSVDTASASGHNPSIAIGFDGFPVISYQEAVALDLKVAKCNDATCTLTPTITTLDSTGSVGAFSSIAIGTDGIPVISYYDNANSALKVARCINRQCTGTPSRVAVDSPNQVGTHTSIVIGSDGLPVVSYYDVTNSALRFVRCTAVDCSTFETPLTLDSAGVVGYDNSIAIGSNGSPIISYADDTNADLKVLACTDPSCTGPTTITAAATTSSVGQYTSITIAPDQLPVISHYNFASGDLQITKCSTVDCSGTSSTLPFASGNVSGLYTSIAIGLDGMPVISYYDSSATSMRMLRCTSPSCGGVIHDQLIDESASVGQFGELAIGIDGVPIMSYYDATNSDLKVARARHAG